MTQARPYAKALFVHALKGKRLVETLFWLEALGFLVREKSVETLLKDPHVGDAKIKDACLKELKTYLSETDENFLNLLVENKSFILLPFILDRYRELYLDKQHSSAIEVSSAFPLTDAQKKALQAKLEKENQGQVELTCHVNPELLGGIVLRKGDKVIDASIKGQLYQLNQSINVNA